MSDSPPCLDLQDHVTEKILERLPLSDYVRFPAVCRQWRSIQTDHRRRHAPSPPPMLKLPWFIPCKPQEEMVSCYSPFEERSYRIRIPSQRHNPYFDSFAVGWLLRRDSIVNPISGVVIPFPKPLSAYQLDLAYIAAVSPPPDYAVFIVMHGAELYLCRQGDRNWTRLMLPRGKEHSVTKAVAFGGKLYCICLHLRSLGEPDSQACHLIVVNPLQMTPAVDLYQMADWDRNRMGLRFREYVGCVVESDGEVLLVRKIYDQSFQTVGYQVFRPDLMRRMWMGVENLGDRLLILHSIYSVSLLAADVGLKGNCIYSSTDRIHTLHHDEEAPWKVFDLGAGTLTEVAFPNASLVEENALRIFMPSIC